MLLYDNPIVKSMMEIEVDGLKMEEHELVAKMRTRCGRLLVERGISRSYGPLGRVRKFLKLALTMPLFGSAPLQIGMGRVMLYDLVERADGEKLSVKLLSVSKNPLSRSRFNNFLLSIEGFNQVLVLRKSSAYLVNVSMYPTDDYDVHRRGRECAGQLDYLMYEDMLKRLEV